MDARTKATVLREARAWAREGLLPAASLEQLEARYAVPAEEAGAHGIGALALFALGGALVGAALITFVTVSNLQQDAASLLLAPAGLLLVSAGLAWGRFGKSAAGLEEVLLVAGCVALGAGVMAAPGHFPPEGVRGTLAVVAPAAAAIFAALPFLVRSRSAAPTLAAILFTVASYRSLTLLDQQGGFFFDELSIPAQAIWLLVQTGLAAAIWLGARGAAWRPLALGASIVACVAPLALFLGDGLQLQSEVGELLIGLAFGAILALALWLRERTAILASALVIAGDAVVFGFDAGGAGLGVVVLLAVAGGLVALAVRFRTRLAA